MPENILEAVFRRIDEYLKSFPQKKVTFTWHGGEPLLLPPSYFERAGHFQSKICSETKDRISHAIQSNLTLLTQGHLDALRSLGISYINTSYDPIANIRGNRTLVEVDSERYNQSFLRNIGLLERNGFSWGVIYVVHRESLSRPLDLYRFLLNIGKGGIKINPVRDLGDDPEKLGISPEEYADFLGEILRAWWPERKRYPQVVPLMYYQETVVNGNPLLGCTDAGECAGDHMYIGPDGSTSLCCHTANPKGISFGYIQEKSIDEIFRDNIRDRIRERNVVLPNNDCKGCRFWKLCHGGCPAEAFQEFGKYPHKSRMCAYRTRFMEKYFEPMTGVRYEGFPQPLS
jgi:uncharacterized protein